jgi:predicted nucleic acid-binding protein
MPETDSLVVNTGPVIALGIFGIINKPSIRKCLKRIPKYIKFSLDYFSEFALVAALGDLQVLKMYRKVLIPFEVQQELAAGGEANFALPEFEAADWLHKRTVPVQIGVALQNTLDLGEAAVIQLALDENIETVCIDEAAGRRSARLNGLSVTGSVGILVRARQEGRAFSMREAIARMKAQGVWLSEQVVNFALAQVGEDRE